MPGVTIDPASYRDQPALVGVAAAVVGLLLPVTGLVLFGRPLLHRRLVRRGVPVFGRVLTHWRREENGKPYLRVRYAYQRPYDPAGPAAEDFIDVPAGQAGVPETGSLVIVLADPWTGMGVPYELAMFRTETQ